MPEVVVAEGFLALAIGIASERAGALAARVRHVAEGADGLVGGRWADAADGVADRLAADVWELQAAASVAPMGPCGMGRVERGHSSLSNSGYLRTISARDRARIVSHTPP